MEWLGMIVTITIEDEKPRHRYRVKRKYDDTVPISRDPNVKRTYTAIVHDGGRDICLGTYSTLRHCWNARKAYWQTKMTTVWDHGMH